MAEIETPVTTEREQTDESLRLERETTDQALEESDVDRIADAVISRAREQADELLAAARAKADLESKGGAHDSVVPPSMQRARALEDKVLSQERADADQLLREERAEHAALLSKEREETDKDLLSERERSDRALATRDEFLGMVSHDLRSMLSSIVLLAGLIEEDSRGEHRAERAAGYALRIRSSSVRMNRLIGDLVDVASIEAGALAVTVEMCDPAHVVKEAVDTFEAHAAAKGISLMAELELPLELASFDPARILQVLVNLLSNAIKFSAAGGTVVVRVEHVEEGLRFAVSDTGPGIPPEKLEVIFERFLQLSHNDRRGLGLGLYISKCIVQGHAGKIWADSTFGKGSTFYFTLPLTALPVPAQH